MTPKWLETCMKYVKNQKELAALLGISKGTVTQWKQGTIKTPKVSTIHKIEKLTKGEVSIEDFLI